MKEDMLMKCQNDIFEKKLVLEDKEGKNINKAEKWIKQNHPEAIGQKLEDGTTITPRILTQEIRNMVPNARMADCKFLVGTTRLYFDGQNAPNEMQSQMNKLNKMLKIICIAHADEYDNNFNGLSFEELDKKFRGAVKKELDSDREEIGKMKFIKKPDYEIVSIDSFGEARKYQKYVSWCVTHSEDMYESYTKGGLGRFYFCLQKGFENMQKVKGDGCPMDAYGKSMIAISVNDDGSLNTCTCRWNHDNGGNDNMMDTKQISNFFGVDFYKTFKPYSIDYLWKKLVKKSFSQEELRRREHSFEADFCKRFGCICVYDDETDKFVFKKLVDGKIVSLPFIDATTTFINGKFVTNKDGKLVEVVPKVIYSMPKDIKGEFVIPNGVTSIGDWAFEDCSGLTSVTIGNGVTSIGGAAFCNCSGLTSLTIPDSVTSIGGSAFLGCSGLTSVTIPNGVTNIGEYMFYECYGLTSVTIPDSVTSIGSCAFSYCSELTSVTIPNSVTYIGWYAFRGCSNLTSVTIPNSVTSIGNSTFEGCSGLTSVIIPNNVTSIGDWAFKGCTNLKDIIFKGKTLDEVKAMRDYPWGIEDTSVINADSSLHESCDPMVHFWAHMLDACYRK